MSNHFDWCVKNNSSGDLNIKFYRSLDEAYREHDRRLGYGISCTVIPSEEYDHDIFNEMKRRNDRRLMS